MGKDAWLDAAVVREYVLQQRSRPDYLERPTIEALLPNLEGKHVLDLGAGSGDWAARLVASGAASVTAVDKSPIMRTFFEAHPQIRWLEADIEQVDLNPERFDFVLSVRTFHYIEHYAKLALRMYDWIVPGGTLVFSVEHPLKYANSDGEWIVDKEGNATAWPVDAYLQPGPRVEEGNGVRLVKWHRPLSVYVNELIRVGFVVRAVVEPDFVELGWHEQPTAAERNRRRPNLLVIRADKASR